MAEQLKKCLTLYGKSWPIDLASKSLHISLNEITNRMDTTESNNKSWDNITFNDKLPNSSKSNGEINFAPYCILYIFK